MHRFEEDPVVPALGAPPGAAGPEYLQHRRPILLCHPRQHGRLLSNRPAKCHRSTNVGTHSPHTQPNPSTRPNTDANRARAVAEVAMIMDEVTAKLRQRCPDSVATSGPAPKRIVEG